MILAVGVVPAVIVRPGEVTVRNPHQRWTVPVGAIETVSVDSDLVIECRSGRTLSPFALDGSLVGELFGNRRQHLARAAIARALAAADSPQGVERWDLSPLVWLALAYAVSFVTWLTVALVHG